MQLYQQEQKGLFTFYKEQDEFEQKMKKLLYERADNSNFQLQSNKKQHSNFHYHTLVKTNKKNQQNGEKCIHVASISKKTEYNQETKHSDTSKNMTTHLEKNRLNRNHKLIKTFTKKSECDEQNSKHLKIHLQQLLKDDQTFNQDQKEEYVQKRKNKENIIDTNAHLTQLLANSINLNIGKNEPKEVMLFLHASKREKNFLKSIISPRESQAYKKRNSEKFPLINKKSYSQKIKNMKKIDTSQLKANIVHKTRYLSPNRNTDQPEHLSPIFTERNSVQTYSLNIEYFHPHRRHSEKKCNQNLCNLKTSENQLQKDLMLRDVVKNIKFM